MAAALARRRRGPKPERHETGRVRPPPATRAVKRRQRIGSIRICGRYGVGSLYIFKAGGRCSKTEVIESRGLRIAGPEYACQFGGPARKVWAVTGRMERLAPSTSHRSRRCESTGVRRASNAPREGNRFWRRGRRPPQTSAPTDPTHAECRRETCRALEFRPSLRLQSLRFPPLHMRPASRSISPAW